MTMQKVGDQMLPSEPTNGNVDGIVSGVSFTVSTFNDANTAAPTFEELTGATIGAIEYYEQGSNTKLESAPKQARTYTAKVKIGDATASVDYRIGQRFHSPVLKSPVKNPEYSFTGSEQQELIKVEDDSIKKVDTTDTSHFEYALGENATTIPTDGWSMAIPKGSGAGPFYVFYRVVGDRNHGNALEAEFPSKTGYAIPDDPDNSTWESRNYKPAYSVLVISPDFDIPPTAKVLTYTKSEQELVTAGTAANSGTMQYAIGTSSETAPTDGWGTEVPKGTNAGDYYVWYKTGVDSSSSTPICIPVTIKKAYPTAKAPTGLTATYGQTLADVSLEGKNPQDNTPGTWAWPDTTTSVGNVGDHNFFAKFTPNDTVNYHSDLQASVSVTVSKATPSVTTPTPDAVTYDPTKTLADVTLPEGWAWVTNTTVPTVGNSGYQAALTVDDANYDYTNVGGYNSTTHKVTRTVMLTVNKAAPTVTAPAAKTLTYTGSAQELVSAGSTNDGTMYYALGTETEATQPYTTSIPTATNAGT